MHSLRGGCRGFSDGAVANRFDQQYIFEKIARATGVAVGGSRGAGIRPVFRDYAECVRYDLHT